ncbi:MAG: hypothetical protein KDJ38_05865 [Gammaproteobacteria bacterium]|nr:hypothetical protein [Gammaproteobacteria bacterium]
MSDLTIHASAEALHRYRRIAPLAVSVLEKLRSEVARLGYSSEEVRLRDASDAVFDLEKDVVSGEYSLLGKWFDNGHHIAGQLMFRSDGSFFVEQDIARMYPGKPDTFVEAVHAWGREGNIKVEARLIKVPFL